MTVTKYISYIWKWSIVSSDKIINFFNIPQVELSVNYIIELKKTFTDLGSYLENIGHCHLH